MNTPSLLVKDLLVRVGSFLIDADFRVDPGQRAAIVGPSGCGKTSLLRAIAGLIPESVVSGKIQLESTQIQRDLTTLPAEKRRLGFVFQGQALFPSLDVLDNVTFTWRLQGVSREERQTRAYPWLEKLGLQSKMKSPVSILSGGERQRVAILRALVWSPDVLLLDEPFSALDLDLKKTLQEELKRLHQTHPVPMLFVTHDKSDLESLATHSIQLKVSPAVDDQVERRIFRI